MKYTRQSFSVELIGARYGYLWGGRLGWQEIRFTPSDSESIRDVVKAVLQPDFETAYLTSDSYVKITLIKPNRRVVRYFDVSLFSSLSQFIGDKELADLRG